MTGSSRIVLAGFSAFLAVFLIAPTLVLIPMSFTAGDSLQFPPEGFSLRWYENLFTSRSWTFPATVSFQVAVLTSILATTLGTLASFGLVRGRFPGRELVNALVLAPLIVPLVIVAVGMFAVFVSWRLAGTPLGLIVAHTVLALPYVVINVSASLRTMERNLELASANLGAGPLRTFWYVTLPQIFPGVAAGALFAFITSWDEVVIAIFLTTPFVQTLPVVMWSQIETSVDPTIAAVATLLTLVTTVLFALAALARTRSAK